MSPSACRSPADSLAGEGTGAGLRHPQESRGSGAPSPACARSPRRWWLAATPLPRPSGEAGFPLLLLLLLLLRLLHLPLRRMPRYPPPVPAHGLPSASRGAAGTESPRLRGALPEPPSPSCPAPDLQLRPQPTCRSLPGRAGPGWDRSEGSAEPAGEAVPSGDSACGRRSCPSLLPSEPRRAAAEGPGTAPGTPGPAKGGTRPAQHSPAQPSTAQYLWSAARPGGALRVGDVQIWVGSAQGRTWGPYEPCAAEPVGMCGLQTLYLWGACMGSVERSVLMGLHGM